MPTHTTTVTTRTTTASAGVAVHTISFRGLAGGIFLALVVASVLYVIGFSTVSWARVGRTHEGLWNTCDCWDNPRTDDWFRAVQAFICLGLIGLLLALVLACIYLCLHQVSKNTTILALVIVCFLSVVFMLIGFIIWGVKMEDSVHWSFAIAVIASILCLVAGILAIVQMRRAGVRV